MLVNFMVIGAQKCGTTTMYTMLNNHPSINGCRVKEPHFFTNASDWKQELRKYHRLFPKRAGLLNFEASTTYTFFALKDRRVWDEIHEYNPDMKFIYIVRNPIDRIVSSYMHSFRRGFTQLGIDQTIIKRRRHIDVTRYHTQIIPFVRRFGRDNVLIVDFDDLVHHRETLLERVAEFLGIDAAKFPPVADIHENVSLGECRPHYKLGSLPLPLRLARKICPPLWNKITGDSKRMFRKRPEIGIELQRMIMSELDGEIRKLGELMERDLSKWLLPAPHGSDVLEPTETPLTA